MKLKYFNINKALEKHTASMAQFLILVFSVLTLITTMFVIIMHPSGIEWYRAIVVFPTGLMLFTYLENMKRDKEEK